MSGSTRTLQVNIVGDSSKAQSAVTKLSGTAEKEGGSIKKSFATAFSSLTNTGIFGPFSGAMSDLSSHTSQSMESIKGEVEKSKGSLSKFGSTLAGLGKFTLGAGALGFAAVGAESVKLAMNFQSAAEHLVTDAGESQSALKMVENGMLAISSATGTASSDVVNGMYHIESAGYHGAQGLAILKAAAEGAKVGNADLDTVSKTLTGTMRSYNIPATQAVQTMNQLITAVGSGDMRMEDLASSLGNVTPVAAAAHVSLAQVTGAIATMTAQNMSAQQATQDLSNTIRALQAPNNVAKNEMAQFGINSQTVSEQLGQRGLTGTLQFLTQTIASKMGPSGQIFLKTLNQSTGAAKDMQIELKAMPAGLRTLAEQFASGKITVHDWTMAVKALPAAQQQMAVGFQSTFNQSHKFNQLLTSGSPAALTYTAALQKIMGGATGLNTALMLTGSNMSSFQGNVDAVSKSGKQAGNTVENWSAIQKTFSQQLDVAKTTVENLGIKIGLALIPKIQGAINVTTKIIDWFEKHKTVAEALGIAIGSTLCIAIAAYVVAMGQAAVATIAATWPVLAVIAACAALGVGIYLLATHWKQVWGDIKQWVKDGYDFVFHHFYLLMAIPFIGWMLAVAMHWREIWGDIKGTFNAVVGDLKGIWNGFYSWFTGIPGDISRDAEHMFDGIGDAFKSVLNSIIGLWDDMARATVFNLPSFNTHIPGIGTIGGGSIGPILPPIPYLAEGGIVTGPTLAMLGDNPSGSEAVIPLEKAGQMGFGEGDGQLEATIMIDGQAVAKVLTPYVRKNMLKGPRRNSTRVGLA